MLNRTLSSLAVVALVAMALSISACGPDYSTPEATMNNFVNAMNAEDLEAAADCMVKDEREKALKEWKKAKENADEKKEGEETEFVFKKVEKDGDWTLGVIEVKETGSDKKGFEMKQVLVEEDGAWKISDAKGEEYMKEKLKEQFGDIGGGDTGGEETE